MGLAADCAASVGKTRSLLASCRYHLCLTDMRLPDGEGLDVVGRWRTVPRRPWPSLPLSVDTENAVAALKAGAFDYLAKPSALDELRDADQVCARTADSAEQVAHGPPDRDVPAIAVVREMIDKLARSRAVTSRESPAAERNWRRA